MTPSELYHADVDQLKAFQQQLVIKKMKLDKFFSVFLNENDLDDSDTTSPQWTTYKGMLEQYAHITHLITTTRYHLNKHDECSRV